MAIISFLLFFMVSHQVFAAEAVPLPEVETYDQLVHAIREARNASQVRIEQAVEQEKVREAWETGKLIEAHILLNKERADYGKQVLKRLSGDLGMSVTEIQYMLEFARSYPIYPTSGKLSWGHYRDLLAVNDPEERSKLESLAADHDLPLSELRKEIKRRRLATAEYSSIELPEITPGPLYTYQIIRLKDRLKIDLGFGVYRNLAEEDVKKFKEGDIIHAPSSLRGEAEAISVLKDATQTSLFTYKAYVLEITDGDTIWALVDLGFGVTTKQHLRLRGIDALEITSREGQEAKRFVESQLKDVPHILITASKSDKYDRYLADVWIKEKYLNQELVDQGLAVAVRD